MEKRRRTFWAINSPRSRGNSRHFVRYREEAIVKYCKNTNIIAKSTNIFKFMDHYVNCNKIETNRTSPQVLLKLVVIVNAKNIIQQDMHQRTAYLSRFFAQIEKLFNRDSHSRIKLLFTGVSSNKNESRLLFLPYFEDLEIFGERHEGSFIATLSRPCSSLILLHWDSNELFHLMSRPGVADWILYIDSWERALPLFDAFRIRSIIDGNSLYSSAWILLPSVSYSFPNALAWSFSRSHRNTTKDGLYHVGDRDFRCFVQSMEWTYRVPFIRLGFISDFFDSVRNWHICAPFIERIVFVHFITEL
jgi:hypothetical protein